MTKGKKAGLAVLGALVVIQFFRPASNDGQAYGANDITHSVGVPDEVKKILETSCYDCHSNHSDPMWYMNIQPVGWWVGHHIKEGKEELNFSEFNTYSLKRKIHKLKELAEQVEHKEMPMSSYTIVHKNAELSAEQAKTLVEWANASKATLSVQPQTP